MLVKGFYWIKIFVGDPDWEEITIGHYLPEEGGWDVPRSDEMFDTDELEVLKFIGETYVS